MWNLMSSRRATSRIQLLPSSLTGSFLTSFPSFIQNLPLLNRMLPLLNRMFQSLSIKSMTLHKPLRITLLLSSFPQSLVSTSSPIQVASFMPILPFAPWRSTRLQGAPLKYVKDHHAFSADIAYIGENSTCTLITLDGLTESIALSDIVQDSQTWLTTIQAELVAFIKNQTWDLVPLPLGKKPLSSKWVLKVKSDPSPTLTRMKARLVAKDYK